MLLAAVPGSKGPGRHCAGRHCAGRHCAGRRPRRQVMAAGGDDDTLRLVAVIDHQRRELDRIRAAAAERSVVAMAKGVLMERLGLSSVEAASQLAELAGATGVSLAELAATVL